MLEKRKNNIDLRSIQIKPSFKSEVCCYPLEEWAFQEIVVGEEARVILKWMLESLWEVFHDLFPVAALDWIWWDRVILPVLDFNENLSLLLKMWSGDCVHLNLIPISIWKQLDFKKKEKHPKLIMSWMKGIIHRFLEK